ncbi:hypothetical protein HAX54_028401 [Datura stramonium]|uniref:Uncharacterized protein n=1 Tax=Datura stramonium TaxID=4076 RepID=A0ABS8V5K4_DATST|nr:hypothetical protein [Datura stramonium]
MTSYRSSSSSLPLFPTSRVLFVLHRRRDVDFLSPRQSPGPVGSRPSGNSQPLTASTRACRCLTASAPHCLDVTTLTVPPHSPLPAAVTTTSIPVDSHHWFTTIRQLNSLKRGIL